jgi:hypothetical protein
MFETPPKMNKVMLLTVRPRACATIEWHSSWSRTETNSETVATAPTSQ